MTKEFKTIDEQVAILKSRGLTISNENKAKEFLLANNYYRVSGYSLTLRNKDVFYPGTTFDNIVDIYRFDSEFRNIILCEIEKVEVKFKSIYAYKFSKIYGPLGYQICDNFSDWNKYLSKMSKVQSQAEKRKTHEAFLKHFLDQQHEPIPLWAFIDLFTISDISQLYNISNNQLKKDIAFQYKLTHKTGDVELGKFMHGMTILRNLCAHGSRLYNRLFITKPSLNSKEKLLLIKESNGYINNSRLFGYILNMKRLLDNDDFIDFKLKLEQLCEKYPFVDMKYYGFCSDWIDKV